jgi:hypothetical protein
VRIKMSMKRKQKEVRQSCGINLTVVQKISNGMVHLEFDDSSERG